jgi:hypothetical protein
MCMKKIPGVYIILPLVKAVQELAAEVEKLKATNRALTRQ